MTTLNKLHDVNPNLFVNLSFVYDDLVVGDLMGSAVPGASGNLQYSRVDR